MPRTALPQKGWLDALVAGELARHDPEAALASLPADVRGAGASRTDLAPAANLLVARSLRSRKAEGAAAEATAAFLEEVRLHVALLLDLAVLRGAPFDQDRRRAEIATFLAAAVGDPDAALEVLPIVPIAPRARDVARALHAAEHELAVRFHPPGDPLLGLPLHPGAVAILRRRLARVAMGFHREGRLHPEALARHGRYADDESVLLVEALAGLLAAGGAAKDARATTVRARQLARLGLSRAAARAARAALASPRPAADLARAAPGRIRAFLVEQLFLAVLRARLAGGGESRYVDAFVAASGLHAETAAAARVEAAAQHGDHQVWFEAFDQGAIDWDALAGEWGAATDAVVERVSAAVTENLGAIVQQLRDTGELGQLLARAAAGGTLSAAEKKKVRAQLIDVAKAVPALAIFAAPGGMLLLPLLAKLLPFDLLPSAWARAPEGKDAPASGRAPAPASGADAPDAAGKVRGTGAGEPETGSGD